jgi:hypothetical protein
MRYKFSYAYKIYKSSLHKEVINMSKSLQYWSDQYDDKNTPIANLGDYDTNRDKTIKDAWQTLELLRDYAGFYKRFVFPTPWGGQMHRFFTGRWNTHFGNDIQAAIGNYYEMGCEEAHTQDYYSTKIVLGFVKEKIGDKPINPEGDLAKILAVIKTKTGVDYHTLDSTADFQERVRAIY